jgi:HlyD family secretion protein
VSASPNFNPVPRPVEAPAPLPPKRGFPLRTAALIVLSCAGALGVYRFVAGRPAQQRAGAVAAARTAKVTSASIQRVARLTGSTSARNYAQILAPRMRAEGGRQLTLIFLTKAGGYVKAGDVVARIDTQAMRDRLDDLDAQITQADADIQKRKAQLALDNENMMQTLRNTKASLDKTQLDVNAAEIRTEIDREQLKLSLEEARATYKEQLDDLEKKKISNAADLRGLELGRERTVRQRDRYRNDIEKFTIRTPISGLVVMLPIMRGQEMGQVQEGDQVAPGQPFMRIVDPDSMQVQAAASQVESDSMRLGQNAEITLDAFPGLKLKGKVTQIGAIATAGARANNFLRSIPVYLKILDRDDRVIPDLSASADVVVGEAANALVIPQAAVESREGRDYVRVKNGERFETRAVKLGLGDRVRVAVLEGLREGEEVAVGEGAAGALVASK